VLGDHRQASNRLAFTGAQKLRKNHGGHGTGLWPLITDRSRARPRGAAMIDINKGGRVAAWANGTASTSTISS